MSRSRDTLIICDSHIFSVRQHLLDSELARQICYLPVLFYQAPWTTLQEGRPLTHDSQGPYSIPAAQFEERVRSGELMPPGPIDYSGFRRIVFLGHFLIDRCIARTLKADHYLYPDVVPRMPDAGPAPGHYLSWPAFEHLVRKQLELHVVFAMKTVRSACTGSDQKILCIPGPPIRRDVVSRAVGTDRAVQFRRMHGILQTHRRALAATLTPLQIDLPPSGWYDHAIDEDGFLREEYSVGPGDSHANAAFGKNVFDHVLRPFIDGAEDDNCRESSAG